MSFHRPWREIQRTRGFFDGQTAKKSQLHNAALLRIKFSQFVQSVVESHHVHASCFEYQPFIQRQPAASIPFGGLAATRVVDQNVPHHLSADGYKMLTVLEMTCTMFLQPEIGLVHQVGALQSVVRAFLPQAMMGEPSELAINERNYGAQRLVVTGLPVRQ
jgi:hypothetical protein